MGRRRASHRDLAYKKRLLSRKSKRHIVTIVTRKEQPSALYGKAETVRLGGQVYIMQAAEVEALKTQDVALSRVSSSWIAALGYIKKRKVVTMNLIDGHIYHIIGVPFKVFEEWYNAHSKGTFWHVKNIRDKYKVVKIR